jgi:hypothetical protein
MARSETIPTEPSPARRRWTWITIATVGIISGSALLAVPAIAADSGPSPSERVAVCESGIVERGNVKTSSAVATRIAADAPLPEGCREG